MFVERGITHIDGNPFFPVGIYLYDFNSDILAEVHQQGFNTIIWGASEKDLPTIKEHGLMWIPRGKQALHAKDKSTILAWYPIDVPEDQKVTPEQVRADYDAIRAADPDRPIGICHYNLEMTKKFKDSEDFVMISAYPVDAARKNRPGSCRRWADTSILSTATGGRACRCGRSSRRSAGRTPTAVDGRCRRRSSCGR